MVLGNIAYDNGKKEQSRHANNYGYKIATNTWIDFGKFSAPRGSGGGLVYDSKILVN